MPKMREHSMSVTVKASAFLSASQVRREVRYSIKEGVGYMAYGPNFEEVKVTVGKVGPMPKDATPPAEPADLRPLLHDVRALYRACGEEDSEEADAIASLPTALNEALADVIRWASPLGTPRRKGPELNGKSYNWGRDAFNAGLAVTEYAPEEGDSEHAEEAFRAGWWSRYLEVFQDGASAADRSDDVESPHPQFSPSWEAWGAGFNSRAFAEA